MAPKIQGSRLKYYSGVSFFFSVRGWFKKSRLLYNSNYTRNDIATVYPDREASSSVSLLLSVQHCHERRASGDGGDYRDAGGPIAKRRIGAGFYHGSVAISVSSSGICEMDRADRAQGRLTVPKIRSVAKFPPAETPPPWSRIFAPPGPWACRDATRRPRV